MITRDVNGLTIRWDNGRIFTMINSSPCVNFDRDDCEKMIKVMQEFLNWKEPKKILFEDVKLNDVFIYQGHRYIKLFEDGDKPKHAPLNCISIEIGNKTHFILGGKTEVESEN